MSAHDAVLGSSAAAVPPVPEAIAIPAERPPLRRVPPASDPSPVAISILIVTWNSARWIERCLRAIPAACAGLACEVIVYDNASADDTLVAAAGTDARIIRSPRNDGFAGGTNRAVEASSGRYMFLLNPDCELAPNALTWLYEFLEGRPDVAAVAPLLVDEDGLGSQREFQLRRLPTLASLASEVLLFDKIFPGNRTNARSHYRDLDLTKPQPIEQPAAAALLVRREVYDEIGPLDERFAPAWFEDVDYCRRLADAGKSVWVVPEASARHFGGASLEHLSFGGFVDVWYRNMWLYARKWLSGGQAEALRWVIIAGMMLRCVAAVAGVAHPEVGRWSALRAYAGVLRKAFDRWGLR